MNRSAPPHRPIREYFSVAGIHLFAGFLMMEALIPHLFTAIPYSLNPLPGEETVWMKAGDHFQFLHYLNLLNEFLAGRAGGFTNPFEFAVGGGVPIKHYYFFPLSLIFSIGTGIGGTVFGYNVLLLLTFPLCGIFTYAVLKFYTENPKASLIGSLVFSCAPFRLQELAGGHPLGTTFFLFPMGLYCFEKYLRDRGGAYLAGFSAAVFSLTLCDIQNDYFFTGFLGMLIAFRFLFSTRRTSEAFGTNGRDRPLTVPYFLGSLWPPAVVLALGLAAVLLQKAFVLDQSSIMSQGRRLDEIAYFSSSLPDFFRSVSSGSRAAVYLGMVPILSLILAPSLQFGRFRLPAGFRWETLFFLLSALFFMLLVLGPDKGWISILYKGFYRYLPFFSVLRLPAKAMIVVYFCLSVLTAVAVSACSRLEDRRLQAALFTLFLFGIVLDYRASFDRVGISETDSENRVYRHLRGKSGKLLEVPIWPGDSHWSSVYEYYATLSKMPMVNGYSPFRNEKYVNEVYWKLFPLNQGEIRREEADWLARNGVRYLAFHEEQYLLDVGVFPRQLALQKLRNSPFLHFVLRDGPVWLFQTNNDAGAEPGFDQVSGIGNFYEAESLLHQTGVTANDPDASGGRAFQGRVDRDKNGFLIYGPFVSLSRFPYPSGRFEATFRVKTGPGTPGGLAATLEVLANKRDEVRVLATQDLPIQQAGMGKYRNITLPFVLDRPDLVEFHLFFHGGADVYLDYILTRFADVPDPQYSFETEDLVYRGGLERNPDTSGGWAVVLHGKEDSTRPGVAGPGRLFPAGDYDVEFRVRSNPENPKAPIADLEIVSVSAQKTLGFRPLMPNDFKGGSGFTTFSVPVTFREDDVVNFQIRFHGNGTFWIDRIDVHRSQEQAAESAPQNGP